MFSGNAGTSVRGRWIRITDDQCICTIRQPEALRRRTIVSVLGSVTGLPCFRRRNSLVFVSWVDRSHGAVTGSETERQQHELTNERTPGRSRACECDPDACAADTLPRQLVDYRDHEVAI
jgi:hypothetical protein